MRRVLFVFASALASIAPPAQALQAVTSADLDPARRAGLIELAQVCPYGYGFDYRRGRCIPVQHRYLAPRGPYYDHGVPTHRPPPPPPACEDRGQYMDPYGRIIQPRPCS